MSEYKSDPELIQDIQRAVFDAMVRRAFRPKNANEDADHLYGLIAASVYEATRHLVADGHLSPLRAMALCTRFKQVKANP